MVNYHEGDPMLPGNAELEPHELAAFAAGDVTAVSQTGKEYGTVCTDYATSQDGDAANFLVGIRALMEQSSKTLTSFRMGVPFMEGVRTGVRSQITEMIGAGRSLELAQGLAALSEFAKHPEVQAAAARQTRAAFDELASAVHAIANPMELDELIDALGTPKNWSDGTPEECPDTTPETVSDEVVPNANLKAIINWVSCYKRRG